ncbi:hydroxymethylglutaryl-CoA lyase [Parasphingorhabdus pacifica]
MPNVLPEDVLLTEVALRDGLQNEAASVPTTEKIRLVHRFAAAGFTSLEVGAFVHPERVPAMADTDRLVAAVREITGITLHGLVFNATGAERAVSCGIDSARLVISASEGHSHANTGANVDRALARLSRCADVLAPAGVALEAAIATAFVCPFDGTTEPARVADLAGELVEMGVTRVQLADTIGAAHPGQITRTVAAVREAQPALEIGLHLHNTYGMALANAREGYREGVRRFDAALGGIGGCPFAPGAAGNIATDDLVHMFHQEGIDTGVDNAALAHVRSELRHAIGRELDSALFAVPATPARRPVR